MKQLYMLKTKRHGIFLALLLLMAMPMAAQQVNEQFKVGGLLYSVLDVTKHTIKVLPKANYLQLTDEADDVTSAYDGKLSGVIDLSQPVSYKGKSWMVTEIGERAFQLEKITEVKLPDGITKIGYKAFFKMPLLTTINFPTSLKIIESQAFYGGVLTAVDIPGQTAIGSRAFESCTKMETLSIPQVTYLGNACFRHCSKLASVTVPASAKIGEQATGTLSSGNKLTDGINQDGTNQVSGQHAFADCYGLKNATIQEGSTTVPTSMFMFCGDLTTVTVPTTVTSIEKDAFRHCFSLNAIDIQNVESIGDQAFWNCLNLKGDLILSSNVKKIGNQAFTKTGFTGVKWEGTAGCTIGNNIFSSCYSLEYVDLHTLTNPVVSKTELKRRTGNSIDNLAAGLLSRTIVYLPQGVNFTFAEGEDVNFVKSNGICTRLSVQDGADYEFPIGFTASTAVYNKWEVEFDASSFRIGEEESFTDRKSYFDDKFICYEDDYDTGEIMPLTRYRDFTGSGNDETGIKAGKNCFTMLLPYEVKLPKGFRAYELQLKDNYVTPQGEGDYTQYYLFRSIPDESVLEANKPYLLRIVDGQVHKSDEFVATNVEIAASSSIKVNDDGTEVTPTSSTSALRNVDTGTLKPQGYKAVEPNQEFNFVGGTERLNNHLAVNLNTWLLNTDYMGIDVWRKVHKPAPPVGDEAPTKPVTAAPFRGYIQPKSNTPGNAKHFVVLMENETTGIDDLQQNKAHNGAQRIYTLDGRYVGTSFDTLPNGIYVIKGKKIVK